MKREEERPEHWGLTYASSPHSSPPRSAQPRAALRTIQRVLSAQKPTSRSGRPRMERIKRIKTRRKVYDTAAYSYHPIADDDRMYKYDGEPACHISSA